MAGKTEWEDALIKHGVMEAPKEEITEDDIHLAHSEAMEAKDPYADLTLKELEQLEDEVDDSIIETYRRKRIAKMRSEAEKAKFGSIAQISQSAFVDQVTNASKTCSVVCLLFAKGSQDCEVLEQCLTIVAHKYQTVKIVKIIGNEAIKNFPDSQCPTLLLYKNGDIVTRIPGISSFGGKKLNAETVEWVLGTFDILKSDLESDPRDKLFEMSRLKGHILGMNKNNQESDDSDDEW